MTRLTFLVLLMTMAFTGAHAQQKPTTKKQTTTSKAATKPATDEWGTPSQSDAANPVSDAPATATTPAPPASGQSTGVEAGASGGFGGDFGGASNTPPRIEGMSVAPGSPLLPASRLRSDYMGRPIERKPSMRPRSQDYNNGQRRPE
ncbi:hypothetical protein [Hymenobacter sp. B81]|uniref:hypothetical protein n=1 Tax=Hymenobacter sp. B81 TaxID=3344878 RepID=UPI0037DDBCA5